MIYTLIIAQPKNLDPYLAINRFSDTGQFYGHVASLMSMPERPSAPHIPLDWTVKCYRTLHRETDEVHVFSDKPQIRKWLGRPETRARIASKYSNTVLELVDQGLTVECNRPVID